MVTQQQKAILLTAAIIAVLFAATVGVIYFYLRVPSTGIIISVNVEVFWDAACTQKCTSIDWGMCYPGENRSKTVYVKNTSNVPMNLTLGTQDWQPTEASNYISLYWSYDNHTLAVAEVYPTTLTLAISPAITGITTFNFNIVIVGTG